MSNGPGVLKEIKIGPVRKAKSERNRKNMDILPEWESIDPTKLRGTLLVVGASDVGKSTFAQYLYGRLRKPPDEWLTWMVTRVRAGWDRPPP